LVRQPTKHRFYRAWVTVKPVGSAKSCRPKANPATKMLLWPTVQRKEPVRIYSLSPLSSLVMRPIAPFSPRPVASPGSSASSGSVGSVDRDRS
ncbi:hypothetical protein PIB30_097793, partial [Stylosanthes scabra]|nr:hypothetical protein [Stylosanthes scabra]